MTKAARAREVRQAHLAKERETREAWHTKSRDEQRKGMQDEFEAQDEVEGEVNQERLKVVKHVAHPMLGAGELLQQITATLAGAFRVHNEEVQARARDVGSSIKDFFRMNPPIFQG